MKSSVDRIIESLRVGFLTVFSSNYWWVFIVQGAILYFLTVFQTDILNQYATLNGSYSADINFMHLLGTIAQIAIILTMMRLILFLFDTPAAKLPSVGSLHLNIGRSWQKLVVYLAKGVLLCIILIIVPGLLYGFFSMKTGMSPLQLMLLMKITFALSLTFFGFGPWILIDRCASLKDAFLGSIFCGWQHVVTLMIFSLLAVAGMMLLNVPPFLEIASYCLYFPVFLAAQGYLYRTLCKSDKKKGAWNIPFSRPPIS
jgi:hypothetical protein